MINGHPYVILETRGRVLQAIRDVGYQPNSIARSLVTRKTRIIGIVIPEAVSKVFSDQFFAIFIHGAAQAANVWGYQLILSLFDDPEREESLYASTFESGFMEGAIIASAPPEDSLLRRLCESSIPTVAVGKQPSLPYVDVENCGGAFLATEHLIKLGYRRIATITGPLSHLHVQDRLEGYRMALEKQGVHFEEDLVVEGGFTEAGAIAAMQKLLPFEPEAIFVQSDTMAAGALRALRTMGIRVPQDMAIVGFDDLPLASLLDPPLTTVRQPIRLLGFMAVELLLDILEGRKDGREIVLPVELVVRESCGAMMRREKRANS